MRTIAHISDLHFGRLDDVVAEGLVRDLSVRSPTLLVASGDFTQRATNTQYAAASAFLKRLPKPQLVVPGNHDIALLDVIRRFFYPLSRFGRHLSRDLRPVFRDDEILVMGMNSARSFTWSFGGFWKDGKLSEEQLLDLKITALETPEKLMKVVVTHHPFIPPPGERVHGIIRAAGRALRMFEDCGIDLLLAGHLHMGYSGDVRTHHEAAKRSILSVQAGTACSTRRRTEPNAWNWITIEHNHLIVEVRTWQGSAFGVGSVAEFRRVDGSWIKQSGDSLRAV